MSRITALALFSFLLYVDALRLPTSMQQDESTKTNALPEDLGLFEEIWKSKWQQEQASANFTTELPSELNILLGVMSLPGHDHIRKVMKDTWLQQPGVCMISEPLKKGCTVHVAFVMADGKEEEPKLENGGILRFRGSDTNNSSFAKVAQRKDFTDKVFKYLQYASRNFPSITHLARMDEDFFPHFRNTLPVIAEAHSRGQKFQYFGKKMVSHNCHFSMAVIESGSAKKVHEKDPEPAYCVYGGLYFLSRELSEAITDDHASDYWTVYDLDDRDLGRAVSRFAMKNGHHVETLKDKDFDFKPLIWDHERYPSGTVIKGEFKE